MQYLAEGIRIKEGIQFPVGALGAAHAHLRVTVNAGALALAGDSDVGIGTLDEPEGSGQVTLPRKPGCVTRMVAANALTAWDPVYALANGKVGDLAIAEPLCGYCLEDASGDGAVVEVMWV